MGWLISRGDWRSPNDENSRREALSERRVSRKKPRRVPVCQRSPGGICAKRTQLGPPKPAPVAWAILEGEREVGVTVHEMVDELDAGPVLGKRFVPLGDNIYIGTVFDTLETVVPELFRECVDALAAGALRPRPQSGVVVRGYPRHPEDGRIDWRDSAEHIARLVRASAEPFGGAFCAFGDDRLTIWRAHAEPYAHEVRATPGQVMHRCPEQGTVHVATVSGAIVLETVEYRDAGRLTAAAAIRSNRSRLA